MLQSLFSMNQNSFTTNQSTITYDLNIFKFSFSKKGKILGIDTGKKYIGLSLSDYEKKVAVAHKTILRKKFKEDIEILKTSVDENDVVSFVIGLPLNKDGSKGPRSQSAITFAIDLSSLLSTSSLLGLVNDFQFLSNIFVPSIILSFFLVALFRYVDVELCL